MTVRQAASAKDLFKSRICGLLLITVLLVCGAHAVRQFWAGDPGDFGHFYRAASAMWKGENIYLAAQGHYIYPPFLAFIFQPLTLLSERTGRYGLDCDKCRANSYRDLDSFERSRGAMAAVC
jgi:hypothetical protein